MLLQLGKGIIDAIGIKQEDNHIAIGLLDKFGNIFMVRNLEFPVEDNLLKNYAAAFHGNNLYIAVLCYDICPTNTNVKFSTLYKFDIGKGDISLNATVSLSILNFEGYHITGFFIEPEYIPGHYEDNGRLQAIGLDQNDTLHDVDVEELFESVVKE